MSESKAGAGWQSKAGCACVGKGSRGGLGARGRDLSDAGDCGKST